MTTSRYNLLARISLGFLWIFTGISSAFLSTDIGYEVLAKGGITGTLASAALYCGSALDIALGIWLLCGMHLKRCYLAQLIVIVIYTVLLTIIDPSFWIHPFGPLTKNIPLLVMIYYLYRKN